MRDAVANGKRDLATRHLKNAIARHEVPRRVQLAETHGGRCDDLPPGPPRARSMSAVDGSVSSTASRRRVKNGT